MSRRFFLLLMALQFAAASSPTSWADEKAVPYTEKKNVIYAETDGIALVINVFVPKEKKNGLAIIDVASGAWSSDKSKIEDHRRARFYDIFTAKGYTVFAIRPGSISKFSAQEMVNNIRTGTKWVQNHADEYGIDSGKMGITGASAGGHLACLTVVSDTVDADGKSSLPFAAIGVFFPPTDFVEWGGIPIDFSKKDRIGLLVRGLSFSRTEAADVPTKDKLNERVVKISPARLVNRKLPPFLIFHGDADLMVPLQQSTVFVEALKKTETPVEFVLKKGGGHPWLTIYEEVAILGDWFDKQLQPKS